jgi:hypothetical protein
MDAVAVLSTAPQRQVSITSRHPAENYRSVEWTPMSHMQCLGFNRAAAVDDAPSHHGEDSMQGRELCVWHV